MAAQTPTAFLDASRPTLANVNAKLREVFSITPARLTQLHCSLRRTGVLFSEPLDQIPAHARYLSDRFRRLESQPLSISLRRLRNIKSDVAAAVALVGFGPNPRSYMVPLMLAWENIGDRIGRKNDFWRIKRWAHFCSARQCPPTKVSDPMVPEFRGALAQDPMVTYPERKVRAMIGAWNRIRDHFPDLNLPRLTLPTLPRRGWTIPLSEFPAPFQTDVEDWLRTLAGGDPLSGDSPPRALRPATLRHRRFQVQMAASALHRSGVALEDITSLATLVTLENFRSLLSELMCRDAARKGIDVSVNGELKPTEAIHGIATTLKSIARHHVKVPSPDLERLVRICKRLDLEIDGIREKNAKLLTQFDDPTNQAKLLYLPEQLVEEARRSRRKDRRTARLVRDAVALDLLIYANLRLENLITIRLDRHLIWIRDVDGDKVVLSYPKTEIKNSRAQRHEFVAETVEHLRLYLRVYRPLLGPESPFLFKGRFGGHIGDGYSTQLSALIRRRTGIVMHIHLFRHTLAILYLRENPGDFETPRRQLNHGSQATTTESYTHFDERTAQRYFQQVIRQRRAALAHYLDKGHFRRGRRRKGKT